MGNFNINLFGGISLSYESDNGLIKTVNETSLNSPKMWSMLAYLAVNKDKSVTICELTEALWESKEILDPQNSIKALVYKLRKTAGLLGFENSKDFIVCINGAFCFSPKIKINTDVEEFLKLCSEISIASKDLTETRMQEFRKLYKGDAMPTMQAQSWVLSYTAYLHTKFVKAASKLLSDLMLQKKYDEAADFCSYLTEIEPFEEYFHKCVIISLLKTGQAPAALKHYDFVSKSYLEILGQPPSATVTDTYKLITRSLKPQSTDVYEIRKELDEQSSEGAYFCDYETFRQIYRVTQRTLKRQNLAAACGAIIVENADNGDSQNLLALDITALKSFIAKHLRIGDVFTQIEGNKFFILINGTTNDKTDMILQRIVKGFKREHRSTKLMINCLTFENDIKKRLSRQCP